MDTRKSRIVELNVGGCRYATTLATLLHDPSSALAYYFANTISLPEPSTPINNPLALPVATNRSRSPTPNTTPVTSPSQQTAPTNGGDQTPVIQSCGDGTYFIDRDGELFRYLLDYLRTGKVLLPDNFPDSLRLREEAKFFKLNEYLKQLKAIAATGTGVQSGAGRRGTVHGAVLPSLVNGTSTLSINASAAGGAGRTGMAGTGYITVGYRGTFAFGRDGQADVKFRKLSRIMVCGKACLCREVFTDTLNESRDPDRGGESRYTSRLYLKHNSLELAFDTLAEHGFDLITSCASGTCASGDLMRGSAADSEEQKWNHYNEFIFYRSPSTVNTML